MCDMHAVNKNHDTAVKVIDYENIDGSDRDFGISNCCPVRRMR